MLFCIYCNCSISRCIDGQAICQKCYVQRIIRKQPVVSWFQRVEQVLELIQDLAKYDMYLRSADSAMKIRNLLNSLIGDVQASQTEQQRDTGSLDWINELSDKPF